MSGLEALLDGIAAFEGYTALGPGNKPTRAYRNRNCGNLRMLGMKADADGFTIFPDSITGYRFNLLDLQDKFTDGKNTHGLGQNSTLLELVTVRSPASNGNDPEKYAAFLALWISAALGVTITLGSKLSEIWKPPQP